jgi:hypothetical protein
MADTSLLKQHERIAKIGKLIAETKPLSEIDKAFLSEALVTIGSNGDPEAALGIKVKRGNSPREKQQRRNNRDKLAMAWIAAAKLSEKEGGLGLTLDAAIDLYEKESRDHYIFGFNGDTFRKYWKNRPDGRVLVTHLGPKLED